MKTDLIIRIYNTINLSIDLFSNLTVLTGQIFRFFAWIFSRNIVNSLAIRRCFNINYCSTTKHVLQRHCHGCLQVPTCQLQNLLHTSQIEHGRVLIAICRTCYTSTGTIAFSFVSVFIPSLLRDFFSCKASLADDRPGRLL